MQTNFVIMVILLVSFNTFGQGKLAKTPPIPKDNPITKEKVELGKMLYFDPRLSYDGTISCNSCHNVMSDGTDARAVSVGIGGQKGGRGAPTVWNSAYNSVQFWDGRAKTLEDQAKGPLTNPIEMGMPSHEIVIERINKIPDYVLKINKVFSLKNGEKITIDHIAKAIATYERTLVTPNSAYDRYLSGNKNALNKEALRGLKTVEKLGCFACHSGPNFNGSELKSGEGNFHKFPMFPGSKFEDLYDLTSDLGRFSVTKNEDDKNYWRVPTLRNIALTAPYFHNGKVKTLDEAVRVMAKTQLNQDLADGEVKDIVAFLNSLSGEFPKQNMPRLPEYRNSTLTVE